MTRLCRLGLVVALVLALGGVGTAAVYNLKVVTDASPDYTDMDSMVQSITSRWATPEEKCFALFYWNHIGRRQCAPMIRHGMALTTVPEVQYGGLWHMYDNSFRITPQRILCVSEVQVFDAIQYTPFDLKIALPDQ